MNGLKIAFPLVFCALGLSAQCSPNTLAVVVNKSNPVESLSMAQLRKLMLGDVRTWPDKKGVMVVRREASTAVSQCVLAAVVRMNDSEYKRYLMNVEFRGDEAVPLKTAASPAGAVKLVIESPGGITVVETNAAVGATALKIIKVNGKLPGEPGYPL